MSFRQLKKDRTRLHILEVSLELFSRQGFELTTINQIASHVEISPRTLLRYFPTKEDIIVSWIEVRMSSFLEDFKKRPTDESISFSLIECARNLLKSYSSQKDFYLALEQAIASSPDIGSKKNHMTMQLAEKVAEVIINRSKSTDSKIQIECKIYPHILFSIIRVVIAQWVAQQGEPDLNLLLERALSFAKFENYS